MVNMPATKIRSKWEDGNLKFHGANTGETVLELTENSNGVTGNLKGQAIKAVAVTATSGGADIPAGATFVTVTSSSVNHIVKLPAPVPGIIITLQNGTTGYELRTSDPANISINGGKGENAESAIGGSTTAVLICVSPTEWVGFKLANSDSGYAVSAIEAAAA